MKYVRKYLKCYDVAYATDGLAINKEGQIIVEIYFEK